MGDINDLIANGIRPPQVEDIQAASARGITLANALQQRQVTAQQMQAGQIQLQEHQLQLEQARRDAADQDILRRAYMDSGGDLAKYQANAMKAGASPKAIMSIQTQGLALKKQYGEMDELTLKNDEKRHDALRGELGSYLTQDDGTKAANWQPWIQQHVQTGKLTPQEAAQLFQQYPQYPGDDTMKLYANGLATGSQLAKEESERRTAASREKTANTAADKFAAELPGIQADAATKQRSSAAAQLGAATNAAAYTRAYDALPADLQKKFPAPEMFDPTKTPAAVRQLGMTADQQVQTGQTAANAAETARHNKVDEAQGAQRVGIAAQGNAIRRVEADPFGALGLNPHPVGGSAAGADGTKHGMEFLGTLPPAMATRVQAIAQGRETLSAREKGSATGRALQGAVEQYDPGWSEQRAQLRKAFTTGPDGRNIGNLNTAPVHLAALADAAKAMQNGSFVPGNQLYNYISTMFGGTAPVNFDGMKTVVAGEMASAMKGNATDPEIASFNHSVSSSNTPGQLADVIGKVFLPALGAKLNTYHERYHVQSDTPGLPPDEWSPVLPSARAAFARFGLDPTASASAPPAAQAGKAGGPAAAAPPLPKSLSASDVGKTYTNKDGKPIKVTAVNPDDGTKFRYSEAK